MDSSTSTKQPDRVEIQAAARSAHRWLVATTLGLLGCALALVLLGLLDWPSPEPIPFLAGESTVRDGSLVLIGSAALALVAVALILGLVGFSERLGDRRGKRQDWWLAAAFSAFALATLMAG